LNPLLIDKKLAIDPSNPPHLLESDASNRPLTVVLPLPPQANDNQFMVWVSATSGLIEIEDSGAKDSGQGLDNNRTKRARMAGGVNDKELLANAVYMLLVNVSGTALRYLTLLRSLLKTSRTTCVNSDSSPPDGWRCASMT
jgi:hypothetical protein